MGGCLQVRYRLAAREETGDRRLALLVAGSTLSGLHLPLPHLPSIRYQPDLPLW